MPGKVPRYDTVTVYQIEECGAWECSSQECPNCIYITIKSVLKKHAWKSKALLRSGELSLSDSPCFTLCRICPVDLSRSAPSIRGECVQFNAFVHMPQLYYKALIVHSASLSGICCTVLVPWNKTPTSISSQPAFRETKMSVGNSHCCTREKNNIVFYWWKANNGRKALST